MTKDQLIAKLQAIEGNPEIIINSSNSMEQSGACVPLSYLHETRCGEIRDKPCRDAFDGGSYTIKDYCIIGGEEHLILLT